MNDPENQIYPVTVLKTESDITHDEASDLDAEIDRGLTAAQALIKIYLATGEMLERMQATKGYILLNFTSWGDYLESKPYGRTYLCSVSPLSRHNPVREMV